MGQAQINVRTRACSRTFIARTKQASLTHHVRGKELRGHPGHEIGICHISKTTVPILAKLLPCIIYVQTESPE